MRRLIACALLAAAAAAAQPNLTSYLETHRQALDLTKLDASLLDWRSAQIIFLGESHGITINEDLDLALLKYLHREAGVRVYLGEWGHAPSLVLNEYLQNGNEAALEVVMRESKGSVSWTKERRDFWMRFRQWNASLSPEQRVRIVGVDVEHQQPLARTVLAAMARSAKGPRAEAIAPALATLEQIGAGVSELAASLAAHRAEYEALLGERLFDFEMVVRNWKRAVDYYAAHDSPKGQAIREDAMYDNFRQWYGRLGGGRWYGRWGSFHVLQLPSQQRDRFAHMLNRAESPVRGKVLSILTRYASGEALMMPGYRTNPVPLGNPPLKPFVAAAAAPLTLFRLDGAGSPFAGTIEGWEGPPAKDVQYVLLVDKAAAQHTLEPVGSTAGLPGSLPAVVVWTLPEAGSRDIPATLPEVRVTFSKEMRDRSWSWCSAEGFPAPPLSNVRYDTDRRTIVANAKLEPGRKYAVWLNKGESCVNFRDAQGNPAVPYLLSFETAAK